MGNIYTVYICKGISLTTFIFKIRSKFYSRQKRNIKEMLDNVTTHKEISVDVFQRKMNYGLISLPVYTWTN